MREPKSYHSRVIRDNRHDAGFPTVGVDLHQAARGRNLRD